MRVKNKMVFSVTGNSVPAGNTFYVEEVSENSQSVFIKETLGRLPILKVSIALFNLVFEEVE